MMNTFIVSFLLATLRFWTNSRMASEHSRDINLINDMKRNYIAMFLKKQLTA